MACRSSASKSLVKASSADDDTLSATNFYQYILPTLKVTPEIEVVVMEGEEIPYGVGEPPLRPIAPAIAAAVLDLTGKAVRELPIRERLG